MMASPLQGAAVRAGLSSMTRHGRPGPPSWAAALLGDDSAPPQLYAWSAANLGGSTSAAPAGRVDEEARRRRIYVLGVGNLGRLFASGLAKAEPRPPITLVVHRRALLEQWLARPGIEMTRGGRVETARDFEVEWWTAEKPGSGPVAAPGGDAAIANLVVATKAADALPQVDRLRRYLDGQSTVAFAQNGMCRLWPPLGAAYTAHRYPGGGPNWVACVTMHGVTSLGPFRSVHASPATMVVGPVLLNPDTAAAADYLMTQFARAPDLAGRKVARTDLWVLQLEKLVVNAVINPLTAVLRCKNGDVFAPAPDGADDADDNDDAVDGLAGVVDKLILEASSVLRALVLDLGSDALLAGIDDDRGGSGREALAWRFGFDRLRAMVLDVGGKVKDNTSSMLQDVRAGKTTEIDAFNGWLVETAEALGTPAGGEVAVPTHRRLMALVKEGAALSKRDLRAALASPSRT